MQEVLDVVLKMAVAMPLSDIITYAKLGKAYFNLLDVLCHHHTETLILKDSGTFSFLLMSLDAGLKSLDTAVSTTCATAVDNVATFYFKGMNSDGGPSPEANVILSALSPSTSWACLLLEENYGSQRQQRVKSVLCHWKQFATSFRASFITRSAFCPTS